MKVNWTLFGMLIILALTACNNRHETLAGTPETSPPAVSPTLLASGGSSTSGSGGGGGYVYAHSHGGGVKVLKSGTVDAVFSLPTFTPDFGSVHYVVSGGTTTVLLDADAISGNLCHVTGDPNLYIDDGNGACDGGDAIVTGLTITAGATLVLIDQGSGSATLRLPNDLAIAGTLTTDRNMTSVLDIEANVISVESEGKITVTATTVDTRGGEIRIGNGNGTTRQIINRGTVEAKGIGTGSGGYMYFEPDDLVVNYGTIDASGGSSDTGAGGSGGELDVYVDYGDFYSSGIVRMNGGKGATDGGDSEADWENYNGYSVYVETAYVDNTRGRNGDIIISGTWEANAGDGTDGRGGYGGYIYLQTDALGAVTINATMSAKGGDTSGAGFSGGNAGYGYGIEIYSYLDPNSGGGYTDPVTPGKIRIAGTYDLRGGNGDESGGSGGYLKIYGDGFNASNIGSDVELVGFDAIDLNGGDGTNGGSAASNAFLLYTYSAGGTAPAGPITNEARIEARGGKAAGAGSTGGTGGYVEMLTNEPSDATTVINNSGDIDISGRAGDTGGAAYGAGAGDALHLHAVHVTNSGALMANGGNGTAAGGNGGNITLTSTEITAPTTNSGTLSAAGGTGIAAGTPGTRIIDGTVL